MNNRNRQISQRGVLVHVFVYGKPVDEIVAGWPPAAAKQARAWVAEYRRAGNV